MSDQRVYTIQVTPKDLETSEKIRGLAKRLRTSSSAVVALALDFVMPKLETGEAQVVNGEVVLLEKDCTAAR